MNIKELLDNCYNDFCYYSQNIFDIHNQIEDLTRNDKTKLRLLFDQIKGYIGTKRFELECDFRDQFSIDGKDIERLLNDKIEKEKINYIKDFGFFLKNGYDNYDQMKNIEYKLVPDLASYYLLKDLSSKGFFGLDELSKFVFNKIDEIENRCERPIKHTGLDSNLGLEDRISIDK